MAEDFLFHPVEAQKTPLEKPANTRERLKLRVKEWTGKAKELFGALRKVDSKQALGFMAKIDEPEIVDALVQETNTPQNSLEEATGAQVLDEPLAVTEIHSNNEKTREPVETRSRKESELLRALEQQALENPLKACMLKIIKNPYATEYGKKRMQEFHDWIHASENQKAMREVFSQNLVTPPETFIGIVHGSCARGHAQDTPTHHSDLDGRLLYFLDTGENLDLVDTQIGYLYPEDDWGARAVNIKTIFEKVDNLDRLAETTDYLHASFLEDSYDTAAMYIVSVFGPGSVVDETSGVVDEWRKMVLDKIFAMQHASKKRLWLTVSRLWYREYVDYEKRPGEVNATIEMYLRSQGLPEEAIPHETEKLKQDQLSANLPSFDQIYAAYQTGYGHAANAAPSAAAQNTEAQVFDMDGPSQNAKDAQAYTDNRTENHPEPNTTFLEPQEQQIGAETSTFLKPKASFARPGVEYLINDKQVIPLGGEKAKSFADIAMKIGEKVRNVGRFVVKAFQSESLAFSEIQKNIELEQAGVNVPERHVYSYDKQQNKHYVIYTDLSDGGKNQVWSSNNVEALSEMKLTDDQVSILYQQVDQQAEKATKAGYVIQSDAFFIKKTPENSLTVYVADLGIGVAKEKWKGWAAEVNPRYAQSFKDMITRYKGVQEQVG